MIVSTSVGGRSNEVNLTIKGIRHQPELMANVLCASSTLMNLTTRALICSWLETTLPVRKD